MATDGWDGEEDVNNSSHHSILASFIIGDDLEPKMATDVFYELRVLIRLTW